LLAGVVGDEQRAVFGNGERSGATPDLGSTLARCPEAGHEILVIAFRPSVPERNPHHLVPGGFGAVPGAIQGHECMTDGN